MANPGHGAEEVEQPNISSTNVPSSAQSCITTAAATAREMNSHENVKQINRSNVHEIPSSAMSKQAPVPGNTLPVISATDDDDSATKTRMSHQVASTAMNQSSTESSDSLSTVISHETVLSQLFSGF